MSKLLIKNYKPHIDGLRAISVIAVIFFHLDPEFISGGFIGVDVFFVISGYLISKIIIIKIDNNDFKISKFFIARARRILPMLFFILLIFFPLSFFLLPYKLINISESVLSSLFFLSNLLFYWESGYFGEAIDLKPFIHVWSLSVEEQFYLIFPIFCIFFYNKKNLFIFILTITFFTSLIISSTLGNTYPNANFFLAPSRVWEISAGILFMFFEKKNYTINYKIKTIISTLSLALIFFSFFYYTNHDNLPNLKLLPIILAVGFLIIFGDKSYFLTSFLSNKIMVFIGLISYSLYMLHQPLLAFNKNLKFFDENMLFKLIFVIVLFSISAITWKYIEQPFRNYNKISNKNFIKTFLTTAIFLFSINIFVILNDGFVSRYSKEDRYLALLNPNEKGRYVSKKFNYLKKKTFKSESTQNLIVMGDSHAQDFINMAYENDYFNGYKVKTLNFHIECYLNFLKKIPDEYKKKLRKCNNKITEDFKNADTFFLVNVWEDWIFSEFKEILKSKYFENKKVFIIGTKNFYMTDIEYLISLSDEERLNYKFELPRKFVDQDKRFQSILGKKIYISPYKSYCNSNVDCKIFTEDKKLISYDGGHLTTYGSKFMGKQLFNNNNLEKYKNF